MLLSDRDVPIGDLLGTNDVRNVPNFDKIHLVKQNYEYNIVKGGFL